MVIRKLLVLLAVLALIAAACGDDAEETTTTQAATTTTAAPATTTTAAPTTTTTEPPPTLGTEADPIKVLFVPSTVAEDIIAGGEILKEELNKATGLFYDVAVPTSYASTVAEMCASPDDTIGFIPAQAYVLANQLCGVEVAAKSIRFGYDVYWTQFLVDRDSGINTLDDLKAVEDLKWVYPDTGSTSGFLIPNGILLGLGIEPTEVVACGGSHTCTARAMYNEEATFGTTFYSPPIDENRAVHPDADFLVSPDIPEEIVATCDLDADGEILCGDNWFPRDARRQIREEAPDVVQKLKIISISTSIPNDTMSFSPTFPAALRTQIVDTLFAFAADDPDNFQAAFEAYDWTGISQTSDAEFDEIRAIIQAQGFDLGDL